MIWTCINTLSQLIEWKGASMFLYYFWPKKLNHPLQSNYCFSTKYWLMTPTSIFINNIFSGLVQRYDFFSLVRPWSCFWTCVACSPRVKSVWYFHHWTIHTTEILTSLTCMWLRWVITHTVMKFQSIKDNIHNPFYPTNSFQLFVP